MIKGIIRKEALCCIYIYDLIKKLITILNKNFTRLWSGAVMCSNPVMLKRLRSRFYTASLHNQVKFSKMVIYYSTYALETNTQAILKYDSNHLQYISVILRRVFKLDLMFYIGQCSNSGESYDPWTFCFQVLDNITVFSIRPITYMMVFS